MRLLIQAKNIFILGIKGMAMANLAVILKKLGKNVIGSDTADIFPTDTALQESQIPVITSFDEKDLPDNIDLAIYSASHNGKNNPQIIALVKKGVKIASQAEIISELLDQCENKIAVCGCHGKTTTSSFLAYSLLKLGVKPSYLVGAPNFNEYLGGDFQEKKYFVAEADEYGINPPFDIAPKFYLLNPNWILCTNIDFDHPDVYENLTATQSAFANFFTKVKQQKKRLIVCSDCEELMNVVEKLPRDNYLTFGFEKKSDLHIKNFSVADERTIFQIEYHGQDLGTFKISLFGKKNISNVAGAILLLLELGFSADKIRLAINDFKGAKRRFELVTKVNEFYLFDDYAHHPNEIKATISAVRDRFPNKRIGIIFQPHTFSRTQALLKEFSNALSQADYSLILPIFPSAREQAANFKITSLDIEKVNSNSHIFAFTDKDELLKKFRQLVKPQDIVFTMGAGNVYELKNAIINIINKL